MKRFLVFAGEFYYPSGGWEDFRADFDTLDEALAEAAKSTAKNFEWAHVVDTAEMKIIER